VDRISYIHTHSVHTVAVAYIDTHFACSVIVLKSAWIRTERIRPLREIKYVVASPVI
jgi:hypothetical protein